MRKAIKQDKEYVQRVIDVMLRDQELQVETYGRESNKNRTKQEVSGKCF